MKAKRVFENIDFKRGMEPKEALELGGLEYQIKYALEERSKYKNFDIKVIENKLEIKIKNAPYFVNGDKEIIVDVSQTYDIESHWINSLIAQADVNDKWAEIDGSIDPMIQDPVDIAQAIEWELDAVEESFDDTFYDEIS